METTQEVSQARSKGIEMLRTRKGHELRHSADRLTRRRKNLAPVAGLAVALTSSEDTLASSAVAVGIGYLHDTDRRDGNDGKESARLLGENTPDSAKREDHIADKAMFYSLMGGYIVRSLREKNYKRAVAYTAATAVVGVRDLVNLSERKLAEERDINTGSRNIGRIKTALFAVDSTLLASPLGKVDSATGKILDVGLAGVVGLSIASHVDMHYHIKQELDAQNKAATIPLHQPASGAA